jgi:hypothetical protein
MWGIKAIPAICIDEKLLTSRRGYRVFIVRERERESGRAKRQGKYAA